MAPKTKFTLNDIIDAALAVVRTGGLESLTARAIAEELKSSTMPIYSCGKTMMEIEVEVIRRCWDMLVAYQKKPFTPDIYVNMGLGYVLFAKNERQLFGCLHSARHLELNNRFAQENFLNNVARLENYPPLSGVSNDLKMKILIQGWIFSHGLADLMSRDHVDLMRGMQSDEDLTAYFLESFMLIYTGIQNAVEQDKKRNKAAHG